VTEPDVKRSCRWCGRGFEVTGGPGRPRLFCSQACRQKDYIGRLRARDAGLAESELIVTRSELEALRDKLFVLECAIDDVRRDVADGDDPAIALQWVIQAAEPLLGTTLGEPTADFT
jgi:hypothetical protein